MAEAPVDDVTVQQDLLTGRVVRWSENPLVWNYTGPFLKFYLFSIMDLRVELVLVFHFYFICSIYAQVSGGKEEK